MRLIGKTVLITGGARRVGKTLALAVARAGGTVLIHHGHSPEEAHRTKIEIEALGGRAHILQADFTDPEQAAGLIDRALDFGPMDALVNNAAIFESLNWQTTRLDGWNRHMAINLTAPFLLCQAFASTIDSHRSGRIVNILDWRALRPGPDHLPYTISKAALASLTFSLAAALAPHIQVNGLALGAILPPSDSALVENFLDFVPARRWAEMDEVSQALIFLLSGPEYITGEIIHLDGGRHLI